MKITKIEVENFRLLRKFSIDLEKDLSLVIGKNNTGKTSLLTVLDKFLNQNDSNRFTYNDFNVDFKNDINKLIKIDIIDEENYIPTGIKLRLFIEYNESDNLANVSRVLMNLDPDNNTIVLEFGFVLEYKKLEDLRKIYREREENEDELNKFLSKEIYNYFKLKRYSFEYDIISKKVNNESFINLDSEGIGIKDIISFKYISAKRNVANKEKENTLSKQTSILYRKIENDTDTAEITKFKKQLIDTDEQLSESYKEIFGDIIKKIKDFGGIKPNETNIEIISTLQERELLEGNTTVVYAHNSVNKLPEHYNGLGYMNLISMIFDIEIKLQEFKRGKDEKPADINLLFIEEPEAHTHPQMQYIFIKNIKNLLLEGIQKGEERISLQYVITTHSSHIVADSDFDDIKYLKLERENNVIAKNLSDLKEKYKGSQYNFLKQYLTISRAEAFFTDKAILIEGDTERILIPTFMKKLDIEEKDEYSLPLCSQNISLIEVGAYSQIFENFIRFLGIKSLIITDIDSINENKETCRVDEGVTTSNTALKYYLKDIPWNDLKSLPIGKRVIEDINTCICYQREEEGYHARSFEDAFIHLNKDFIIQNKENFRGLKNRKSFDDSEKDAYDLAQNCVDKKTHFALDILYYSDENLSNWKIPVYIKEGLLWLKKD